MFHLNTTLFLQIRMVFRPDRTCLHYFCHY